MPAQAWKAQVLMCQGCALAGWGDKCKKEGLIISDLQQLASPVYTCMIIYVYLQVINACYSVNRSFEENGSFNPGKEIKAETQTYYQALIDNRDSPFIVSFSFLCHKTIILINNGSTTEWSPVPSLTIRLINQNWKTVYRVLDLVNYEYDFRPN